MAEAKTNTPDSERLPLPALGYPLLLAVLAACGLYAVFISGPAMRIAARNSVSARSDNAAFAACSRRLAIIRQKQVDRDNAAAQGIL
ncbi:hypothetical protein [Bradyrhizobium sp. 2S1]|uniref:hypothetical protein n=1 Tax=Bradyrhizobium sp. 2S1 TaxID=1404429 RepID=UPI001407F63A|nr:hypothetical protein [Bradyrhizobium sp. 2S1]MCK7668318.1 hypothetical protein [Bradyrhizobium sp. 2S1]